MYFVAMLLQLHPVEKAPPLSVADGVYAHAALLHTISSVDADAGRQLHEMHHQKRMTIALLVERHQPVLRLTFMAEEGLSYAHLLLNRLVQEPVLRLGCHSWAIEAVDLTSSPWTGVQSWADLLTESASPVMRFTFATPTAIMKQDGNGGRFTALYPDPLTIFGGLAWRWRSLAGPTVPAEIESFLQHGGCVIAAYALQTTAFQTQERTQIGFQGWVIYECRQRDVAVLSTLNALARLAFFTGVGYQTMRGMGTVQVHLAQEVR